MVVFDRREESFWLRLQEEQLDERAARSFLSDSSAGGTVVFLGTTRQWTGTAETAKLTYDCYTEMAVDVMTALVAEAKSRWPVLRVCICHRLGEVPVAEASVLIGVASPHRADAFEAARHLIDRLKEDVPIWKQETYADGTTGWVGDPLSGPNPD